MRLSSLAVSVASIVLLVAAASAQTYPTIEECIAGYMKQYNLSDVDAKAKCTALFQSPTPAAATAVAVPPPTVSATSLPVDECIAVHMKEKRLSYDEAKKVCAGAAASSASPAPGTQDLLECIARLQKEKGLGYDEAKRTCVFGSATSAPSASEFEKCVAKAMEEKGFSKEGAARVCAAYLAAETTSRPSAVNVEGCIEKHVLGGLSREEATKTCASVAISEARIARAEPPKTVRAEVAEKLKEKVAAARSALGTCVEEVKSAVEQCVKAGRGANQCREEAAGRVREACKRPDLASVPAGSCVSKCQTEAKACAVTRGEEACRKESLACLAECPEAAGGFAELAMKMQRLQEIRMSAKEVRAVDEGGNTVEATGGAVTVKREFSAPAAAAPGAPEAPAVPPRAAMVLNLPLKLAQGKRLASFQHEASGMALEKDELSIPMKSGAEIAANIRAKVREVVGRGNVAEAVVERLKMETKAVETDLSAEKPSVGKVLTKVIADLKEMPEEAEVKMKLLSEFKEAQEARKKALEETARQRGLQVKEVAYAVQVEHRNLSTSVEGANVTLTVSRAWVESQGGPEKVRIFREGDDGTKQVLETTFVGWDGDTAIFEGRSPGLSVFSLVAVEEGAASAAPQPAATRPSPPYGFIALVAVVAIGVALALGLAKRPPGGKINPWLRLSMKASGDLKGAEEIQKRQNGG